MKPPSLKQKFACALVLPLLGLLGLMLWNTSSHSFTPESTSKPNVRVRLLEPKVTTTTAIHQLKQDGSYDSLQQAFQAALAQPEPVRTTPADVINATHTMATPWRGLRSYFGPDTVHVRPSRKGGEAWKWDARLVSYGYGANQQAVERAEPVPLKNGIEYRRGSLTEWYLNDQRGLEQGFTLATRPAAADAKSQDSGPLTLTVAIDSDLTPRLNQTADSVAFIGKPGEPVLHYAGLLAWDAKGERLAARIELRPNGALALCVDDRAATYPVTIDPLIYAETELTAFDGTDSDEFGRSVAISGDTIVVGAARDNIDADLGRGMAYVFVRNGSSWTIQQKFTASDAAAQALFGNSVAIDGNTVVVGAINADSQAGSAYVFVRSGTTWTEQQKLMSDAPAANDHFGASVAISGDTATVGAPDDDTAAGDGAGSVHVFVRNGAIWSLQQTLAADDAAAADRFGSSAAIRDNTLVVGARGDDAGSGSVYIFIRDAFVWTQQQKLVASDAASGDGFGGAVSIDIDSVVVGANGDTRASIGQFVGAAYVFIRSGTIWNEQQKLTASDAGDEQFFGTAVAIRGDTIIAGALRANSPTLADTGAAYVFTRSGTIWSQQQKLNASNARTPGGFGKSVSLDEGTIVVGAPLLGLKAPGSAYVYEQVPSGDLLISQAADKTSVKQNDVLTYTITVKNFGPNQALNVVVNDTLAAGTVFKSAHANKGQFTAPPPNQNGVVTWHVGDMFNGDQESAQLVVTVTVKGKATLTNTATVQSDSFDPNLANNSTTLVTSVASGSSGGGGKK